mmetsp:Transcript_32637/g.41724  ORF Transcript_32637/g.41724 Transcript_32637/m.41724 type:complete len:244 (-) Transcript_32637:244-975(-)|eukprot:CAMPEP_0117754366 /NCGR_PEP_ID=MMETSP0947-20121206/12788_1 /TAXON_ID=44440 /ORGANISM="Chattonella subsalsa, Strain CCMP2191" /LENGTH=243 /DNA_ID=CAMNT_0005573445 /DNA_START=148 /DNA_END=879 /DNA_ORIENTATION=+
MFDFGFGEMIVIVGGVVLLGGKKELPVIARYAGKGLGKVVGIVKGFQGMITEYSDKNELAELHKEVKAGLDELNRIKYDISSAASTQRTPVQLGDRTIFTPSIQNPGEVIASQLQKPTNLLHSKSDKKTESQTTSEKIAPLNQVRQHVGNDNFVNKMQTTVENNNINDNNNALPNKKGATLQDEDTLSALAIADITFRQDGKDSFAQKQLPGGANVLNECILNSLLAGQLEKTSTRRSGSGQN